MVAALSTSSKPVCPLAFEKLNERYEMVQSQPLKACLKVAIAIYSFIKEMLATVYFAFEKLARSIFYLHAKYRIISPDWLVFKPEKGESAFKGHVVLIHGYLHDEGCWTPWVKELLDAGMAVYIPRLDKFHRHGITDYTQKVRQLIEKDIEQPVLDGRLNSAPIHLLGHSMGGLISCSLAGQKPKSFATVSCIGAPLHGALAVARIAAMVHPCVSHMTRGHEVARDIREALKHTQAQLQLFSGEYDLVVPASSAYLPERSEDHISVKYCGHLHLVRDENVRERALAQIMSYAAS
jgi:hypothetical protein